jgi:hypothetical protein
MNCDNQFYIENLSILFSNIQVVPTSNMNLSEQLNAMTRLVIIIFIIMLLFNIKYSMPFLIISLSFIIIIYYIQTKTMKHHLENYQKPVQDNIYYSPYNPPKIKTGREHNNRTIYYDIPVPETNLFSSGKTIPVGSPNDPPSSWNNELTRGGNIQFRNYGGPPSWINDLDRGGNPTTGNNRNFGEYGGNPITKIKPVVIPPTHDLEYWKDNNLIFHSAVNTAGLQEDMYLSGYAESTCCDYLPQGTELVPKTCGDSRPTQENYSSGTSIPQKMPRAPYCKGRGIVSPTVVEDVITVPTISEKYNTDSGTSIPQKMPRAPYCKGRGIVSPTVVEDVITVPYVKEGFQPLPKNMSVMPETPGMINTDCGYNPEQIISSNLPSNYSAGMCEQTSDLQRFNENLFTQTVTPGVYTMNQVNEPINSNIGISFQQQFEPTTMTRDDKGLHYLQHDPRLVDNTPAKEEYEDVKPNYDNVYDPRLTGYGTSYRSYFEPVTGQTRFMYDDVNAIRMPNYIVRSKIDHLAYADSYGPIQEGSEFGNIHTPHMRSLVQDSWMRDSINFRNDMTQLLMRKTNSEAWQQRQAPFGQRTLVRRGGTVQSH